MRVGIDCIEAGGKPTGLGRFLRALLGGLADAQTPHEFYLYHLGDADLPEGPRFIPKRIGGRWRRLLREQIQLPRQARRDRVEVFYSPGYWLPLMLSAPSAFTLHDVSFLSHPEWFSGRERLKRTVLSRLSARRARMIVTDSEFSRGEILRHYRVQAGRVVVTTVGVEPGICHGGGRGLRERFGIRGRLIISVGSLFERRRTDVLLDAFSRVLDDLPEELTLWVAGENRTLGHVDYADMARGLGIGDRVIFSGYTDEETLRDLYAEADLLVYLSEYEGFGLPPLEASACGVPVVTSRGSSLEEYFAASARMVDPRSPSEVATAIATILSDSSQRQVLRTAGLRLAERHTPQAAARAFLNLIERLVTL
ncbi:MAG: glycosyltransferase family 1 protein [Acidobacteriota bacterium]